MAGPLIGGSSAGRGGNVSDAEVRYSLGVVSVPTSFRLLDEISADEYERLSDAIASITRLNAGFHYKLVERNYLELKSIHQFVTITLSLGRDFATPNRRKFAEALMTSLVNWLTAMRLFLDHEETALKRRFGRDSPQVARFKSSTAAAYDARVGYRFAYRFRNFVQHCGLPLSRIEIGPVTEAGTRAKQAVDLVLDRDELLDAFEGWGPVEADLRAMPPTFGLLPFAAAAMDGLREVHRACTDLGVDEALERCGEVVAAVERIQAIETDGFPAVFRYRADLRDVLQIRPTRIPVDAARKLLAVRSGKARREILWSEPSVRSPLPFDPASIRDRFHRDNRGVQVLSAWLTEKGGSPAFFRTVNQIIAEDQNIEPLITGLINVSAVLAQMTAGALGASAEGLVAGLLDIYGEFDRPGVENTDVETSQDDGG